MFYYADRRIRLYGGRPVTLGQEVASRRKQRGWTQKDLASRTLKEDGTPISPQYLNDIERDRRVPSSHVLDQLAAQLGAEPDDFHFLAGQVHPDLLAGTAGPERLELALKAFRRTFPG